MTYEINMTENFVMRRKTDDVFDYIVDFSRLSEWDHSITSSKKVSSGTVGLGTCFDVIIAMGPRQTPISYEITDYDFPNRAC